ncbi:MAG: glycogen/starch synthase [Treponema sp.]|nr:glycogen/starch synthase [Treponema sp.]
MKIWIASYECSGILEAGGVKNVTFSLCKEFSNNDCDVTLFLPFFGCTSLSEIKDFKENVFYSNIFIAGKNESVSFSTCKSLIYNFNIVFINHSVFLEKEGIYTYTINEEKINSLHKKGSGHEDSKFLDTLFSKAVSEYANCISKENLPDIIHCQDASTAMIPFFVSKNHVLNDTRTVVTIHNAGPFYHHEYKDISEAAWLSSFPETCFKDCMNGKKIEPFLVASEYGALLTTVSPYYAEEITNPIFNHETDGLASIFSSKNIPVTGITNGIDADLYEPAVPSKSLLPYEFCPEKGDLNGKYKNREYFLEKISENDSELLIDIKKYGFLSKAFEKSVFLCYQGRLATQKGLQVFADAIPEIIKKYPEIRIIITGQGETQIEDIFIKLALSENYAGKILFLNGYNKKAARLTVASGDFIILPSFFEPCCLEDFTAMLYGTIPIAHKTGGLNKIIESVTGFLYEGNTPENLAKKIFNAIDFFRDKTDDVYEMQKKGASLTRDEYLWDKVCKKEYIPLFMNLLNKNN